MDTDTRSNLRALPNKPVGERAITISDFDAQFDRDKTALIREATLDVEADLELLDLSPQSIPPRTHTRLVKNRALHRALVLDGSAGASAVTDEYHLLLNQLDMFAFNQEPIPLPKAPPRGRKPKSDDA